MVGLATSVYSAREQSHRDLIPSEVGPLPRDWQLVPAGQIGTFRGGNGFPHPFQGRSTGTYPFFKVSDMNNVGNETSMIVANNYISDLDRQRLGAHIFPTDTIVFAKVGAAIFLERKRILAQPSCIDNNMAGFRLSDSAIDVDFIRHYLLSIRFGDLVSTTALPSLNGTVLRSIPVPLPPTKQEQQAIAEALTDVDVLIDSVEALVAKKRAIKQGAMQDLLSGQRRLPGFNGEWDIKTLGDLGEALIGLTYSPNDVSADGTLVLRSSNIADGALRFDDNVYVTTPIADRIMVRNGDILICVRNGSRDLIGKCAKIDERCHGMTFGAFMAVFRTPYHEFLYHQFQSDIMKRQIHEHLGATINQITNKSLKSFQVPFPMDEMERTAIAEVLFDMDSEISGLELKLQKARQMKQGMMQELLTGRVRLV